MNAGGSRTWRVGLGMMVFALAAVACGGASVDGPRLAAFCDAYVAAEPGFDAATRLDAAPAPVAVDAALAAGFGAYEENATGGAAGDIREVVEARTARLDDLAGSSETASEVDAEAAMERFAFENCLVDGRFDAIAIDYEYNGIAREVRSGRLAFGFENLGSEYHEAVIVRIVDESVSGIDEVLELAPADRAGIAEVVGSFRVRPGEKGGTVVSLEPGRYAFACLLPIGATTAARVVEGPGTVALHESRGMKDDFLVR